MKPNDQPVYETSLTLDLPCRVSAIGAPRQPIGTDNRKLGQSRAGEDLPNPTTSGVDFAFLVTQTFGDAALEHDLLRLFVAQARKILALLSSQSPGAQADSAHLLKGSARGIGAWGVAAAAERFEAADPAERPAILPILAAEISAAEAAIETRRASGAAPS